MRLSLASLVALLAVPLVMAGAAPTPAPAPKPPSETLAQLVARLQTAPVDSALREQVIAKARATKPPPALPEDAMRRMARGNVAAKDAKSTAEHLAAAAEFDAAALAAPWHAPAYREAGLARERGQDFVGAAAAFKWLLVAAPDAKDVNDVRTRMYEFEFLAEKAAKAAQEQAAADAARAAEAQRIARANQILVPLQGSWHGKNCQVNDEYFAGCNEKQASGTNWYRFNGNDGPFFYQFKFQNDGTVKLDAYESWAECKPGAVWGVALDAYSLSDVRWEFRNDDGSRRPVFSEIAYDGSWLKISCDRPLSGADPNRRYHYVIWFRP